MIEFFKDRSIFAVSFPIQEQAKKGEWNFKLNHIYLVAILDFRYDEKEEKKKFERYVQLKDQDGDLFYEKLHFKFLQMPLFTKTEAELETRFDKWCYFLKNLESFDHIPAILKEPIFEKAFKTSEIGAMTKSEYENYQESLIGYWEAKGMIDTAREEGVQIGLEKGEQIGLEKGEQIGYSRAIRISEIREKRAERKTKLRTAISMKQKGFDIHLIAGITELNERYLKHFFKISRI